MKAYIPELKKTSLQLSKLKKIFSLNMPFSRIPYIRTYFCTDSSPIFIPYNSVHFFFDSVHSVIPYIVAALYILNEHAADSMQIQKLFFSPNWLKESSQSTENISRFKPFWNGSRKVFKWFLVRVWKPIKYHWETVLFRLQKNLLETVIDWLYKGF